MKGLLRRAVCAAAGALAYAGAAQAAAPVALPFLPAMPIASAPIDLGAASLLDTISYGPPATTRLTAPVGMASVVLADGLDIRIGGSADLAGRVAPFDNLFLSTASSGVPYNALAGGGNFAGASVALTGDLRVNLSVANLSPGISGYTSDAAGALARLAGEPAPYEQRGARSALAGVSWDIGGWGELGLTGSQTVEHDSILGAAAPGADTSTTALGVSAKVHLGNGWVTTASYSEGISQLDLKPGTTPAPAVDTLHTRSYGIAIAKNGLFGDDALGLAVSRPALGGSGGEFITVPGISAQPAFFSSRNRLFEGPAAETDVEIGYVTTFLDGSVALQTNASFQMNYAGQYGANAVSLLSRARIKF